MLAGIGIVLITATACGERPASVPPAAGPTPPPSTSASPWPEVPTRPGGSQQPPQGSVPVPASQLDVSKLSEDYPRQVSVSADGKVLYIRAEEGGCGRATGEVQQETAEQVVVNLRETQSNMQGRMCTMDIRYPLVSVPLSEPLGQRKVVLVSLKQNR
ncbi:hypothetical protein SAMN05421835_112120 [Amycolatopsis sacchari]|uniref:Uncharacterized protein n=1 Tax=Amycolatopsis sacchari TaxID=115433 RepID=A0A1I3W4W8_9PSEU|nr:hypothetical protein [Amycolatopsis sacchari]SFK02684.1 hypothetical protein SAMN05421835_112120 [Amycolatopsis sacchari]